MDIKNRFKRIYNYYLGLNYIYENDIEKAQYYLERTDMKIPTYIKMYLEANTILKIKIDDIDKEFNI